jgi:hypothetical protein
VATVRTPLNGAVTQIYAPAASGTPHCSLINEGLSTAYIGNAQLQPGAGLPLAPGQRIDIAFAQNSLYAVCAFNSTATATALSAAASSAGATSLTVLSGTGIANGQQIQIGALGSTRAEVVNVTAGGGTTTLTVSPATSFDHRLSDTVTLMTPVPTTVRVETGTT